jgi:uncharacterized damage-inducible protein DinB
MLARMLDHLIWADERTARALASLPTPDADAIKRYAHILGAEAVWLERVTGTSATVTPWPEMDLAACSELARRNHAALRTLLHDLTPTTLTREVRYTNTKGASFSNSVEEVLHHVAMHGMYHRGQVAMRVRELGGTPLATDFIAYVREVQAAPLPA